MVIKSRKLRPSRSSCHIELPYYERVAVFQFLQTAKQGGELQGRILVVRRDAGTAVFHAFHFATDICNMQDPCFKGLPAMSHNLPIFTPEAFSMRSAISPDRPALPFSRLERAGRDT